MSEENSLVGGMNQPYPPNREPERFYDDQGVQVAEFDIFITFASDLGEHKWLIECRDRPSQGTAPGSWIEQLIGRKFCIS